MANEEGNSSLYKNLLFIYEQVGLLWDACNQLQKDNEVLPKAVIGLQENALEVKARMAEEDLQKELKHYVEAHFGNP